MKAEEAEKDAGAVVSISPGFGVPTACFCLV